MTSLSTEDRILASLLITVAMLSTVGNALVCAAFLCCKTIRIKKLNYFVFSLAVSDLLVGILAMPYYIAIIIHGGPSQYKLVEIHFYKMWISLDIFCGILSITHLVAMSIDRMAAIVFPLKHKVTFTERKTLVVLSLVWMYAFILSSMKSISHAAFTTYTTIIAVIGFFTPLLIIIVSYYMIYCTVRKRQFHNAGNSQKYDWKLAKIMLLVISLFTICWLPFFTLNLLFAFSSVRGAYFYLLFKCSKFLHYSNSCVNPLIYAALNPNYKTALKKALLKFSHRENQTNEVIAVISSPNKKTSTDQFTEAFQY